MNNKRQRIAIATGFAVFMAAFSGIEGGREDYSHKFDWEKFMLEAVVILIVGAVCFIFVKPN
jgi:hypothetical protein